MGMSTDAIAIFGWAYTEPDWDLGERLAGIFDEHCGQSHNGVVVGRHCCDSEPYYYIAAEEVIGSRGFAVSLQPLLNHNVQEMTERLETFCRENDIPFQQPQYTLLVWADL